MENVRPIMTQVDEFRRLNEKSGMFQNLRGNQIKETNSVGRPK